MQFKIKGETKLDEPMSLHTSIRTGGKADYFVTPLDMEDLLKVIETIKENPFPHLIIGEGTNMLFPDQGFRGCIIRLGRDFEKIRISSERVYAGAASKLRKLIHESVNNSLSSLEYLYGIPGTVGGAANRNSGAYGTHFGDFIQSVTGIDKLRGLISFKRDEIEFGYRKALYPDDIIITEVELKLVPGSISKSLRIMEECLEKRRTTQPLSEATAGCIFKNPSPGLAAGKVIEECGLKGRVLGDAMISLKHANFIVNKGQATTTQILSLIELVADEVQKKMGIELEPEVEVIR